MHLGIDLGTSCSRIARVDAHGTAVLIPDHRDPNQFTTPSIIHLDVNGVLVGHPVMELLADSPALPVVRFIKSKLGQSTPVAIDSLGRKWPAEAVAALLLLKLRRDARVHNDEPIGTTLLAVPHHFSDLQRRAAWRAGRLAGLAGVDLIEEPLAAATHYAVSSARVENTVLVYNLGSVGFDATVLRTGPEGLSTLASQEVLDLGGASFDNVIVNCLAGQFQQVHQFDPREDPATHVLLRHHAAGLKHRLSAGSKQVRMAMLLANRIAEVVLTQTLFERLSAELVNRTIRACEAALRLAAVEWRTLDQILLVGGSTLMPAVEAALRRTASKPGDWIRRRQPDMAIVYGAAALAGGRTGVTPRVARRISSADLGFRVIDPVSRAATVQVVIPRNTPIPVRKTSVFYTNRADQQRMIVEVVQARGEADDGESLGHFAFQIERPRKNHPLEVTLGYDPMGLVTVDARDPDSGREVRQDFGDAGPDPKRMESLSELISHTHLLE